MAGNYGIKETEEALDLGFAVLGAVKDALADGSINLLDFPRLFGIVGKISPAVEGAALIPKELSELDQEDSMALLAYASAKLGEAASSPALQAKVNAALKVVTSIGEAYAVFKA